MLVSISIQNEEKEKERKRQRELQEANSLKADNDGEEEEEEDEEEADGTRQPVENSSSGWCETTSNLSVNRLMAGKSSKHASCQDIPIKK